MSAGRREAAGFRRTEDRGRAGVRRLTEDPVKLDLDSNLADPDDVYRELIDSPREMGDEEAARMNCKLVLLLANPIGDREVFREALRIAGGKTG